MQHALDEQGGVRVAGALQQRLCRGSHRLLVLNAEDDQATLGLVADVRPHGLESDGKAYAPCDRDGFVLVARAAALRHGHAVGGQHGFRLALVKGRAAVAHGAADDVSRVCTGQDESHDFPFGYTGIIV